MSQQDVLEVVIFKTNTGISDEAMLAAADAVQAWVVEQPGYISRSLAKSEDGQWVDVVRWRTLAEATAAAELIMSQSVGEAFGAVIDVASINMLHADVLRSYAG